MQLVNGFGAQVVLERRNYMSCNDGTHALGSRYIAVFDTPTPLREKNYIISKHVK